MRLAITGGRAKGRVLRGGVPVGVRPTPARMREALFSMIGQQLDGVTFLDAFAGTGLVGLEAWSRGARVTLCEQDRRALGALQNNVRDLGADVQIRRGDASRLAGSWQVVFFDPPYSADYGTLLAALAPRCLATLVVQGHAKTEIDVPPGFERGRDRRYGDSRFTMLHRLPDHGDTP